MPWPPKSDTTQQYKVYCIQKPTISIVVDAYISMTQWCCGVTVVVKLIWLIEVDSNIRYKLFYVILWFCMVSLVAWSSIVEIEGLCEKRTTGNKPCEFFMPLRKWERGSCEECFSHAGCGRNGSIWSDITLSDIYTGLFLAIRRIKKYKSHSSTLTWCKLLGLGIVRDLMITFYHDTVHWQGPPQL